MQADLLKDLLHRVLDDSLGLEDGLQIAIEPADLAEVLSIFESVQQVLEMARAAGPKARRAQQLLARLRALRGGSVLSRLALALVLRPELLDRLIKDLEEQLQLAECQAPARAL